MKTDRLASTSQPDNHPLAARLRQSGAVRDLVRMTFRQRSDASDEMRSDC